MLHLTLPSAHISNCQAPYGINGHHCYHSIEAKILTVDGHPPYGCIPYTVWHEALQ